jgi:hypothetical protein
LLLLSPGECSSVALIFIWPVEAGRKRKEPNRKPRVLTEDKYDEISGTIEQTPGRSPRVVVDVIVICILLILLNIQVSLHKKTKLRGFGPRANYTDRATAACWRS